MNGGTLPEEISRRAALLSREEPEGYAREWAELLCQPLEAEHKEVRSVLIVRAEEFWLALPADWVEALSPAPPVSPVPYRRDRAFLGLCAYAGDILLCCSLGRLLGLSGTGEREEELLILREPEVSGAAGRWALRVHAVSGLVPERRSGTPVASPLLAGWTEGNVKGVADEDRRRAGPAPEAVALLQAEALFAGLKMAVA